MAVAVAMLRAVNLGSYQKVSMDALKNLCTEIGLQGVQTYIQSGNVVFRESAGDLAAVARRLEDALEEKFGFRPDVLVRTPAELRKVIASNPFAARPAMEGNRLLVVFLATPPSAQARDRLMQIPCEPEELRIQGREIFIYYPDGMAHPKMPIARIEKLLQCQSTGRNWNTVNRLLAMAEALEAV